MLIDHLDQNHRCANVADDTFTKLGLNALIVEKNKKNEKKRLISKKLKRKYLFYGACKCLMGFADYVNSGCFSFLFSGFKSHQVVARRFFDSDPKT